MKKQEKTEKPEEVEVGLTPEQVQQKEDEKFFEEKKKYAEKLKKKYGVKKVIMLAVPAEEEDQKDLYGWIRKPGIKEYSALQSTNGNMIEGVKLVLNTCWLAGDDIIKTGEEEFMAVVPQIEEILKVRPSYVVNF